MSRAAVVPRFFVPDEFEPGGHIVVGEDAARHMRVLRLGAGAKVALLNGSGARAASTLRTLARRNATIDVDDVEQIDRPPQVHALVPVADRDRMLWLAEKCAELALSSWRPVLWKRSRSVVPRGEGGGFHTRVRARMASALEQSGGAWLPETYPDATPERAVASLPEGTRLVMDVDGAPIARIVRDVHAPVTIAIGPEGGFDDAELSALEDGGFQRVSLGPQILRFETAGVVALAHVRATLAEREITP